MLLQHLVVVAGVSVARRKDFEVDVDVDIQRARSGVVTVKVLLHACDVVLRHGDTRRRCLARQRRRYAAARAGAGATGGEEVVDGRRTLPADGLHPCVARLVAVRLLLTELESNAGTIVF